MAALSCALAMDVWWITMRRRKTVHVTHEKIAVASVFEHWWVW
jgi:hypothetical protein